MHFEIVVDFSLVHIGQLLFIAPKASAEGACILSKMGYYFRVWLVTEIVVCVVTVMLWYMGHT